jgi:hypothetical protein
MSSPLLRSMLPAAAVGVVVSLVAAVAAAQAPARAWQPPRTADGQPDIQGYWDERNNITTYSIETGRDPRHTAITGQALDEIRAGTGRPIAEPADGMIPYQPWAKAVQQELIANHMRPSTPAFLDPVVRGFLNGVPRINYQSPIQILQQPGYVVFLYEYHHAYRLVPLDGRPHVPARFKLWMGDSRGHWEGDTLVVDVTNNNDQTWFDVIGDFHTDAMHLTERWRFVDSDRIEYSVTVDDPKAFTRPMTLAFTLGRNTQAGYEPIETAVWEGNRSPELIFRGR